MPAARPLPKKFLASLEEAQFSLRLMAQRARRALEEVEGQGKPLPQTRTVLREIEAGAYRLALDLSRLEVAGSCDGCPAAPATTALQAQMLVLANELERQAALARRWARGVQGKPELASLRFGPVPHSAEQNGYGDR